MRVYQRYLPVTLVALFLAAVLLLPASTAWATRYQMTQSFPAKDVVRLTTHEGDCVVKNGAVDQIEVTVHYRPTPGETFEPELVENGQALELSEVIAEKYTGGSTWTVLVPEGTRVEFHSKGGDFRAEHMEGVVSVETSGDVELNDCRGGFDVHTTKGKVKAQKIVVASKSEFSSETGEVEVRLANSPGGDLRVASIKSNVTLDFDGRSVEGRVEFVARSHGGRIKSPYEFDREEEFTEDRVSYERKSFTRKLDNPKIAIATGSGIAELKR
ncbi:hypothetical protein GF377_07900 [candidate division GN15 bacterium]|nr:hypothetical protein [candidate division GN15 bacterium]